jgi:hypothetical protein
MYRSHTWQLKHVGEWGKDLSKGTTIPKYITTRRSELKPGTIRLYRLHGGASSDMADLHRIRAFAGKRILCMVQPRNW